MGTINNAVLEAGVFINLDLSKCRALGNTITGVLFYTDNPELPENEIRPSDSDFNIIWDNRYIKSIVLPDSLQTIGDNALCCCENYLESVTIGSGVRNISDGAFYFCFALTSVTFRGSGAFIETDRVFYNEGAGMKAAYEAGGSGTYTLSEGEWTKR